MKSAGYRRNIEGHGGDDGGVGCCLGPTIRTMNWVREGDEYEAAKVYK